MPHSSRDRFSILYHFRQIFIEEFVKKLKNDLIGVELEFVSILGIFFCQTWARRSSRPRRSSLLRQGIVRSPGTGHRKQLGRHRHCAENLILRSGLKK